MSPDAAADADVEVVVARTQGAGTRSKRGEIRLREFMFRNRLEGGPFERVGRVEKRFLPVSAKIFFICILLSNLMLSNIRSRLQPL